jgi:hypothetical protein
MSFGNCDIPSGMVGEGSIPENAVAMGSSLYMRSDAVGPARENQYIEIQVRTTGCQ